MRMWVLVWVVLAAAPADAQVSWSACQGYANLAAAQDAAQVRAVYGGLEKSFAARAIYAERLTALQDEQADATLLASLPANAKDLQDFWNTADCARVGRPVARLDALAGSFNSYFVDAAQAVVRHPEAMRAFVQMMTQFGASPANADLTDQMCPAGAYVYLHRKDATQAALTAAHANAKAIAHSYEECP